MSNNKNSNVILYGRHACFAALNNPQRKINRIYVTNRILPELPKNHKHPTPKILAIKEFDKILSKECVHQGIAIETSTLVDVNLKSLTSSNILVALDQVTDPQNVGAILRSCAAFNAGGLIFAKDNAPTESGALAKTASGTLETVPICKVTNLSRALDNLKKDGYWIVGLDGHTDTNIDQTNLSGKTVLVMGAEGKGLRKLTKDNCDMLVRLPISNNVESLNVSNATAIALYEINRKK